ncbi:aldo/keto reductase [Nocardia aurantia]|uniref:Pyridoxine 4-dehydrogenase n=1 Tax=Nocardia aurantia TaxID=2585199 RepID=A0A7K0DR60_9NOCA|nr:aldo/keto reductase [Nocardia aurantia]MQY28017.1 Pyridoxine 4-dehydrogenase [Nocardia aurantia]
MTTTFLLGGDLPVHRIGYGAMRLTDSPDMRRGAAAPVWRPPTDRADAVAVLRRAIELGVNLIDTADSYALGANEELVADALHPYRDDLVIATKIGNTRPGPDEWVPLGHPAYLRQQAELSLRRLRVDHLDLLYLHRVDPAVPFADQIGALHRLRAEGKVRHIGLSEVSVAELAAAQAITPIAAVQNRYNLIDREHEPVLEYAAAHGIAFVPYFPIAMGAHAGPDSPVATVAAELGATPGQVALAWLLRRSEVVVPIPGTVSPAHLAENVGALDLALSDDRFARLSALGDRANAA